MSYFEDYTGAELLEIFRSMCKKNGYTLDDETEKFAAEGFRSLYDDRDENFGNARDVRNVFERAVSRQSDRVAAMENPGKEDLMAITVADLREDDDEEESPAQAIEADAAPIGGDADGGGAAELPEAPAEEGGEEADTPAPGQAPGEGRSENQ